MKNLALTFLAKHILAMRNDAYLTGHPEWHDIIQEAEQALNESEDPREKMIEALDNFAKAYNELVDTWHRTPSQLDYDNKLSYAYPFDKSFDELEVPGWVDDAKVLIRKQILADSPIQGSFPDLGISKKN